MQLQQTTYKISKLFLKYIPRSLLIILSLLILTIIIINAYFMFKTNHTNLYKECLQQYYQLTHISVQNWITKVQKRGKFNFQQGNEFVMYANSSTLIKLQQSNIQEQWKQGPACHIELGYNSTKQPETIQINNESINRYKTLGYFLSNNPLFYLNITDTQMIEKHSINLNKIILPKIKQKYLLFINSQPNLIQQFVYSFIQSIQSININIIQQVKNNMQKQSTTIYKIYHHPNLYIKKIPIFPSKQQTIHPKSTITPDQKTGDHIPIRNLSETKQNEITKNQNKQNEKPHTKDFDVTQYFPTATIFAGHHLMFKLDQLSEWQSYKFSSINQEIHGIVFGTLFKLGQCWYFFCLLVMISIILGIFVRYLTISLLTILSIIIGKSFVGYAGWVYRYLNMIKQREGQSWLKRGILKIQLCISITGMYILYTIMSYILLKKLSGIFGGFQYLPINRLFDTKIMTNLLIIEIFHYFFCRSRTSLKFFPQFSALSTVSITMFISKNYYYMTLSFLNIHLFINIFFMLVFMLIQKIIQENPYQSIYKPTFDKPRMLFYLGYDLDWHRGIPPIWTQFQIWFDLSYVSENERAYIDKKYELLYGRLMGINQAQQLPQDEQEEQQQSLFDTVEMLEVSN